MRILTVVALFLAFAGCASGRHEEPLDCLSLGGGFEGADPEAIEAECSGDPRGSGCEADDYIESDAGKCVVAGSWSDEVETRFEAVIGYSYGYRTVIWSVGQSEGACSSLVDATSGDFIGSSCGD